jgi:hypothetical protein
MKEIDSIIDANIKVYKIRASKPVPPSIEVMRQSTIDEETDNELSFLEEFVANQQTSKGDPIELCEDFEWLSDLEITMKSIDF